MRGTQLMFIALLILSQLITFGFFALVGWSVFRQTESSDRAHPDYLREAGATAIGRDDLRCASVQLACALTPDQNGRHPDAIGDRIPEGTRPGPAITRRPTRSATHQIPRLGRLFMRLCDVPIPRSAASEAAATVLSEYASPALANHAHRSYLLAAALGASQGLAVDIELLYVAAVMHDLGLEPAFDNVTLPFENAGAHLVSVLTAGAGWPRERRDRAGAAVIAHMQGAVDPEVEPEGYLLEAATSLDISGRDPHRWPAPLLTEIRARYPRLDLSRRFLACFCDQAERKPGSAAAQAVLAGLADRLNKGAGATAG